MAGRPKIQFADDAKGNEAWALIEKIQEYRKTCDFDDLERELEELREIYPHAVITSKVKTESAGDIVLSLLRSEIERIDQEACRLRDNRELETQYKQMDKAVVTEASGKVTETLG